MAMLELHLYIYIYVKMYRDEKTQGLQRIILFVELFANVKLFSSCFLI